MENVLLIGAKGGIGSSIKKKLHGKYKLDDYGSKDLDLSNEESIKKFILKTIIGLQAHSPLMPRERKILLLLKNI